MEISLIGIVICNIKSFIIYLVGVFEVEVIVLEGDVRYFYIRFEYKKWRKIYGNII